MGGSRFLDDPEKQLAQHMGEWSADKPGSWSFELEEIHRGLQSIDEALERAQEPKGKLDMGALFRGPLADSMTHVGQLAMLRRLSGNPVADDEF